MEDKVVPSNAKLADPAMSTGTCLRAPASAKASTAAPLIQPSVIRLLLKLIGPLLTSAVLVLCSSFDEVRASNRQRIEPVVERQTALLCREPRSLYEQERLCPFSGSSSRSR